MFKSAFNPFIDLFQDALIQKSVVFFSLLIILLPVALITGPAVPDIIITSVAIFFLFQSFQKKLWGYFRHPLVIGILIFCFYGIARSLFSEFPIKSLDNEGSAFYFRYLLFALGFAYLLKKNPHLAKCFLISLILCAMIVSIDAYYQSFTGFNFFGNSSSNDQKRLTGLFGDEAIIGRYICYIVPLTFTLINNIYKTNRILILLSISFLVFSEIIVFLSGERAPFFYISTFSLLIVIFIPKYRLIRLIGLIVTFFSILFIMELKPEAKERMLDNTIDQISSTEIPYMPYSPHHEQHYIGALKISKDYPIFGIGTNLFRYFCNKPEYVYKQSCSSHPHNYYIQILSEKGLVGLLFLLTFYGYFCYLMLRQFYFMILKKHQKIMPFNSFLYVMMLVVFWWPIIPTMSFYNNWNNVFYFIIFGLFLFNNKKFNSKL